MVLPRVNLVKVFFSVIAFIRWGSFFWLKRTDRTIRYANQTGKTVQPCSRSTLIAIDQVAIVLNIRITKENKIKMKFAGPRSFSRWEVF